MQKPPIELGRVVLSRAGRDMGRYFVVIGMADEEHVLLADGDLRKIASPKRKKRKHLTVKPACMSEIQTKLEKGEQIQDAQIRKFLALSGYGPRNKQEE
ncbi:MAG: RNA-binding protein [Candidatus Fimadaptatus sp.]